jgi:predicted nicotinamide N-methyase
LEAHADLNDVEVGTLCKKFEKLSEKDLAKFDWIIGGDICFWDSLSDALFKVIKRAKKSKVKKVIIADPERSPFWDLVDRCLDKVDADMEVVEQKTKKPRNLSGQLLVIDF